MAITRPLQIETAFEGDRARLTLIGELDIATVPRLEEAVDAVLAKPTRELVLDIRPLGFLDSSGLREFIVLADRAEAEGWRLVIVRPGGAVLSIFQITRAEENLPFVDEPPVG
jgi:anti-sigma B factor antagonist